MGLEIVGFSVEEPKPKTKCKFTTSMHLAEEVRDLFWLLGYVRGPATSINAYFDSLKKSFPISKGTGVAVVFRLKPEYVRVCLNINDSGWIEFPESGKYTLLVATGEFNFEENKFERVEDKQEIEVDVRERIEVPWKYLVIGAVVGGVALSSVATLIRRRK